MKLTKSDLKQLVKECLVELLNEGISGFAASSTVTKTQTRPQVEQKDRPPLQLTPRRPPPQMREAIKREAGGNKIMESILADTAASTLPKMIQNEGKTPINAPVPGGLAEQLVSQASPEDLFGDEVASKWASLAFADSPINK